MIRESGEDVRPGPVRSCRNGRVRTGEQVHYYWL